MITILHTYYNQSPELLNHHLKEWKKINNKYGDKVKYVIIDDCSDTPLYFKFKNLTIYRILNNIQWNQGGARNLGFFVAPTQWVFCSDIDHVLLFESFDKLYAMQKQKREYYKVARIINEDLNTELTKITGGGYLINKDDFFDIGGYDEDFSGHYGYEDLNFHHRAETNGIIAKLLPDIYTVCYPVISTLKLNRETTINRELYNKKINKQSNGEILRFRWVKCG
jgi:hypothetical protein